MYSTHIQKAFLVDQQQNWSDTQAIFRSWNRFSTSKKAYGQISLGIVHTVFLKKLISLI